MPGRLGLRDNPVRVIDAFVEELDLAELKFCGVDPEATGRPKLYIYGYLNRVQSSRRLERESGRNVEVMWLTGRLVPDHKTIADFRKDNGPAIRKVCVQFVALCRQMGLLTKASVAIDGSKAVNNRDKNFTRAKMERRLAQIDQSVARRHARAARSNLDVQRDQSGASRDGSTNMCSKRCNNVSIRTHRRCAYAARRLSIPSATTQQAAGLIPGSQQPKTSNSVLRRY
jgi:transposase